MDRALLMADRCWETAYRIAPEFVEDYLRISHTLLKTKPEVQGDEFREYCKDNGLQRPAWLHPNVWVSGVRVLQHLGWIRMIRKVEPVKMHNHMPTVTLWKSLIFFERDDDE